MLLTGFFKNAEVVGCFTRRSGEVGVEGDKAQTGACYLGDQILLRKMVALHVLVAILSQWRGMVDYTKTSARLQRAVKPCHDRVCTSELVESVNHHNGIECRRRQFRVVFCPADRLDLSEFFIV